MRSLFKILLIIFVVLGFSLLLTLASEYFIPGMEVRPLAIFYLSTTLNPWMQNLTANSPEAVTAIVWDYRGLDTLFETAVFYLALIAGISLARGISLKANPGKEGGLSVIVKSVTKITAPMIIAVGASIGLHGHLTPGGGFQGGATIAVIPLLIIIVFSIYYLLNRRVTKENMLMLRSIGLVGIGVTALAAFLTGLVLGESAYVFQNMAKPTSPVTFPATLNGFLISGSLWFFNFFEMIAVAAGFTIAFLLLTYPSRSEGEEK
ncbi:MAG: Na(+)/H(+) antiporter subunit B [Thermosphaera sp.]